MATSIPHANNTVIPSTTHSASSWSCIAALAWGLLSCRQACRADTTNVSYVAEGAPGSRYGPY